MKTSLEGAVEIEMLPEKFKDVNYSDNKVNQLLRGADVNQLVDSNQTLCMCYWKGERRGN